MGQANDDVMDYVYVTVRDDVMVAWHVLQQPPQAPPTAPASPRPRHAGGGHQGQEEGGLSPAGAPASSPAPAAAAAVAAAAGPPAALTAPCWPSAAPAAAHEDRRCGLLFSLVPSVSPFLNLYFGHFTFLKNHSCFIFAFTRSLYKYISNHIHIHPHLTRRYSTQYTF